jgi:hypothetical protein
VPNATELQYTLLSTIASNVYWSGYDELTKLGIETLSPNGYKGTPIPNVQWISEMKRWMSFSLATLQTRISEVAVGPSARHPATADDYDMPPKTHGARQLCARQKMRKPGGFV